MNATATKPRCIAHNLFSCPMCEMRPEPMRVPIAPIVMPDVKPNSAAGVDVTKNAEKIAIASPQANATDEAKGTHPWRKQLAAIFQPDDYLCVFLVHGTETYIGKDGKPHPTVQEHWDTCESIMEPASLKALQDWERQGWNIFVCIGVFDREKVETIRAANENNPQKKQRRTETNIATDASGRHIVRCVAIECDSDGRASAAKIKEAIDAGLIPAPTIVIRSSTPASDKPDASPKYHFWWATMGLSLEQQAALNAALQEQFGGDPAAKDTVRVLRLAGFVNNQPTKYPHRPVATLMRDRGGRYSFEDFKISVQVKPLSVQRPKASSDKIEFICQQIEDNAAEAGFELGDAEPYLDGGFKYVQTECPNADMHTTNGRGGSCVFVLPSGARKFSCFHGHCNGEDDSPILNWEWFKNHLNQLADKELDWTEKGMLITHENEQTDNTPTPEPPVEDVKATSLLVFKAAEDVARATELGLHSLRASDFVLPVPSDFAFRRVVLFGSPKDKTFADISSGVTGKGAIYAYMPRDNSKPKRGYNGRIIGSYAEHLTDISREEVLAYFDRLLHPNGGVAAADIRKPQTRFVEVPVGSAITIAKTNVAAVAVKPEIIQRVNDLLFNDGKGRVELALPKNAKRAANLADKIVYDDLKTRGKFYNANGLGCLVLHGLEESPIKISEHETDCLDLLEKYELNAGRPETNAVGKYLGVRANKDGERVSLCISFHYNPKAHTAYYAEQPGVLLKVTKDDISKIRNGEEGVLFTYPEKYDPWEFSSVVPAIANSLIPARGSALYEGLFKGLLLEDSVMSDEQKHILLTVYLILLFLPWLNKSKILLQMQGPSGSGKSFFLETVGRMLLGPQFATQPMPSDVREFENQVVNSSYIAYDNVNKIDPAIKDLLCQVATGLTVTRRELFTTSGEVKLPALATVALSSINPVLTEVEHTNRSLILSTKPRDSFFSSVDLLGDLDKQRGAIMTEIVHRVRMVLAALDAQQNYRPKVNMRLADTATFLLRVARHEGWEDKAKELLTVWTDEQITSSMADDDIGQAMVYALRNADFKPAWKTPSDFRSMLVGAATQAGMALDWWATRPPKMLSTILVKNAASYQQRYGLEFETDDHTKNRRFRLNPSPELLAVVRTPWEKNQCKR